MEKESGYKIAVVVFIIILFFLNSQYKEVKEENIILRESISQYQSALSEANDNIEEANSIIEDAQGYAWSSYEDMGYALDNLSTVDTVSEPW